MYRYVVLTTTIRPHNAGMADSDTPITRELVAEAVGALTAAGRRASWREVRRHLGKGSPNTILAHLRALDAEAAAAQARNEPQPPAAITDLVGTKVWQAALAAAREQAQADMQDLRALLQAEEARCADLAGMVERLEEQVVEARRHGDAQVEILRTLVRNQEEARTRDQALAERLADLAADQRQQAADQTARTGAALQAQADLFVGRFDQLRAEQTTLQHQAEAAWAHLGQGADDQTRRLEALLAVQQAEAGRGEERDRERRAAQEQLAALLREQLDHLARSQAEADRVGRESAHDLQRAVTRLGDDLARTAAHLGGALRGQDAALDRRAAQVDARFARLEDRLETLCRPIPTTPPPDDPAVARGDGGGAV
jgi:hypothetical protein